jgi:DNA-binding response OmpR family regulator
MGEVAVEDFYSFQPDLIILDIMLPDIDGWEVAKRIRLLSETVLILMLTARGEVDDRVRGLRSGADDYLVKPFAIEELLARINALLRRAGHTTRVAFQIGNLHIDPQSYQVHLGNREIILTKTEFDLLLFLVHNVGIVLSREKILQNVWGPDFFGTPGVVEVYMNYLRKKLGGEGKRIKTVRGVGYTFMKD